MKDTETPIHWALPDNEIEEMDRKLDADFIPEEKLPDGWVFLQIAVPKDFATLFYETIEQYKQLRETDKMFPALEAIIMEAKNAVH